MRRAGIAIFVATAAFTSPVAAAATAFGLAIYGLRRLIRWARDDEES